MELCWQLKGGGQTSAIINLAAGTGSRLGSCLLNDLLVPVQVLPSGDLYMAGGGGTAQRVDTASVHVQ